MNQNYGEVFCEAVDEIVRKRLEGISYDSTVLCRVVDDSKREEGLYVVTHNNTTKFEAFSTITNYRNNDNVYVQIPNGDWNQQKIIIAKKTDKNSEPYAYQKPFETLVDITGNLITTKIDADLTGLVANSTLDEHKSITLWTYNVNIDALSKSEGSAHTAYSRLGIQAGFKSLINPFYVDGLAYNVTSGDYGLRLIITAVNEKTSKETENTVVEYVLYLNCADMTGNPYDFQTYYIQEKVFDISQIGKIQNMQLEFYQTPGSFKSADGLVVPCTTFLGSGIRPNLYTNDVYISLGYDVNEFDSEQVHIYTLDSTTYVKTKDQLTNSKDVQLRWIHKVDNDKFISVTEKDDLDYEIRWYRYQLGAPSADEYSGVYWNLLATQRLKTDEDRADNINTFIKNKWFYEIKDKYWLNYNKVSTPAITPSFFNTYLFPDITVQQEQIKAIVIYNNMPYRSNILVCENEDQAPNKATIDAVQALSIKCSDDTYGNYCIYNYGNRLLDSAEAKVERYFVPLFNSSFDVGLDDNQEKSPELKEAEQVEWIIPTVNTMIELPKGINYDIDNEGRAHIIIKGTGTLENNVETICYQKYYIKNYYSQNNTNNIIQCKVTKNSTVYTATKELTFGIAGTTGTDYTFILDFDDGITAVTNTNDSKVTITARLYDYENNEINISDREITWSWKGSDDPNVKISTDGLLQIYPTYQDEAQSKIKTISCEIKRTATAWSGVNYGILQASMDWGDWELIAYLPIPIRSNINYQYISGTTQVIYNSAGEIFDCARNPYRLYYYDKDEKTIKNISAAWACKNGESGEAKYTPTMKQTKDKNNNIIDNYLSPLSFYVKKACERICVTAEVNKAIVWSQPILIMQNTYPSAMLNEWDGALKIDESNGAILAPRMVAGIKDDNNTFSGVVLGNWGSTNSDNSLTSGDTGLYGFDKGEQSYGFRQDGTAFIGKSSTDDGEGTGRIIFNGTSGTIESAAYPASGMSINLAAGTIDADDFSLSAGKDFWGSDGYYKSGSISLTTEATQRPLQIGSNFSVEWDGTLHAAAGDFAGNITASNISGGTIDGSTITGGSIAVPKENPLFEVNGSGKLTATGADITGTITAKEGKIGDWAISNGSISAGNTTLSSDGGLTTTNGNFKVDKNGVLKAKGVEIDGKITATSGTIGGWYMYQGEETPPGTPGTPPYIDGTSDEVSEWKALYTKSSGGWTVFDASRTNAIAVGVPDAYVFRPHSLGHGAGKFRVLNDGSVIIGSTPQQSGSYTYLHEPLKLNKNGSIDAGGIWDDKNYKTDYSVHINEDGLEAKKGKIATWNIGSDSLWSGPSEKNPTLYYGTNGKSFTIGGSQRDNIIFKAGSNFGVDNNGKVYANDLNITGGTFTIKNTTNKTIFAIAADGTLTATAGTIGCWSIKDYQLEYNDQVSKAMRIGEYGFKYFWHNTHFAVGPADETGSAAYYDKPISVQPYLALNFGSRHGILDISSGGMYFGTNINSDNALGIKMDGSKGYLNGNWELPNDEQVQANKNNIATNKTNISTLIDWYVKLDARVSALEKK